MKKIILLFKLLLFLTQLVKMETLPAANTQFSLDLFKKISGGNASGNVFYSPISISSALAMVSLGAKGNTAEQMFKVISHLCIFLWPVVFHLIYKTEVNVAFCIHSNAIHI